MFKKSTGPPKTGKVQENVTFLLLFGKTNIFRDDLNTLQNGTVQSELIKVVHRVSPPSSMVAYISGAGQEILKIHDASTEKHDSEVTYFALKKDLDKFANKFLAKVTAESEKQLDVENNGSAVDSDSDQEEEDQAEEDVPNPTRTAEEKVIEKSYECYDTDEDEFSSESVRVADKAEENLVTLDSTADSETFEDSDGKVSGIIRQASTSSKKYVKDISSDDRVIV